MLTMTISTNRPGHRVTDVSVWGPTFFKKGCSILQASTSPITWNPLGAVKIVSRDKLLNQNCSYHLLWLKKVYFDHHTNYK